MPANLINDGLMDTKNGSNPGFNWIQAVLKNAY
jgi:hypothetical protein